MKTFIKNRAGMIFIAFLLTLAAAPAMSQSGNPSKKNAFIAIEVPDELNLSWNLLNIGSVVDLTGPNRIGEYEYTTGHIDNVKGGIIIITANTEWDLTVAVDSDVFAGGSGIKPSSDVYIDTDALNTYPFNLNGLSPVTIFQKFAPNTESHSLFYKIIFTPQDSPGVYSLNLTYTLIKD